MNRNFIVDAEIDRWKTYAIQPRHISGKKFFWDAFADDNTANSAKIIVRLCQAKGGWIPFTKGEIDSFFGHDFPFDGLCPQDNEKDADNLVILGEDGRYRVTREFIIGCFNAAPASYLEPKWR